MSDIDGFVTSPDKTHEWMCAWFGEDSGEWNRRALEEIGVHAMGGRSYESWVRTGPRPRGRSRPP